MLSAASRSTGAKREGSEGGSYVTPGRTGRPSPSDTCLSASVILSAPSVSTTLEYLPMISTNITRSSSSPRSPRDAISTRSIRSKGNADTRFICPPPMCLRRCRQKASGTSVAVMRRSVRKHLGEAAAVMRRLRLAPFARIISMSVLLSPMTILSIRPPASRPFSSSASFP